MSNRKDLLLTISATMIWSLSLNATSGASRKSSCQGALNYAESFYLERQSGHDARMLGQLVNMSRVQRHLRQLTGITPIDRAGKIRGRETDAQKKRVRDYLTQMMEGLGLEVQTEKFELYPDSAAESALTDLKGANVNGLREYWGSVHFKDLKAYLLNAGLIKNKPSEILKITEPMVDKIYQEVEARLESHLLSDTPVLSKDVYRYLNYVLDDINQLRHETNLFESSKKKRKIQKNYGHNLIIEIPGTHQPDEIIELSAHYDTIGQTVPGADDNGSGMSTLIEAAQIFSEFPPRRTIRLVFTDLEEKGMIGSQHHVEQILERRDKIIGAVIVDTIAWAPLTDESDINAEVWIELGQEIDHGSKAAYQGARALSEIMAYQFDRYSDRGIQAQIVIEEANSGLGDHGPYWENGVPAVFVAAPFDYKNNKVNPGYHTTSDTMALINWGYFEANLRWIIESVALMAYTTMTKKQMRDTFYAEELAEAGHLAQDAPTDLTRVPNAKPKRERPVYSEFSPTSDRRSVTGTWESVRTRPSRPGGVDEDGFYRPDTSIDEGF